MKPSAQFLVVALALCATVSRAPAQEEPASARPADATPHEHFAFTQAGKNVKVWCFVPPAATPSTPVVFVMHGVGRNGEDYLADWIPHAREKKFVLVVPEFSKAEFPAEAGYNFGNTVTAEGAPLPREQWAFTMIESIFDQVRARLHNTSARYRLYGHSAGGQFVQRFVYFVPSARVERVVAANAGWYMLPVPDAAFPYGLKNSPVTEADVKRAFALPVTILLGTADVDPKAKALRHTPEADAQGMFRFARGNFYFDHVRAAAGALHTKFAWQLATAPGIAHSDAGMAPFAVKALFPE